MLYLCISRESTINKVMDVQLLCILITRKTKRCISVNWYVIAESTSQKNADHENERNVYLRYHVSCIILLLHAEIKKKINNISIFIVQAY